MVLQIKGLSVNYGYVSALRNISLHVEQNEIVCLIGSNGAGKSTTLMSISGLVEKAKGQILYEEKDITKTKPHEIVRMGICHIPEGRQIFPDLTVEENLTMGTISLKKPTKAFMSQKMEEQFVLFPRLKERRKQLGGTLSGGEQQMLAIARGLMSDPKLVMLDEPSLGLAPIVVEEIFELIQKIQQSGKTVLLIEQNATMALSISNRGYVLENGKMVLTGTGKELLVNDEVKRAYLGD